MRGGEIIFKKISEKEKGYLLGLFEGDGYKFSSKRTRHYYVEYYLNSMKDKDIIKFLLRLFKKMGLNCSEYKDKRYNCLRLRVYSKVLFNHLKKDISLEGNSRDFNLGYVSGLIDSEGYVNKVKSMISIVNTKSLVLQNISNFLKDLNVDSSLSQRKPSKKDKLKSYVLYISVKFKNASHLSIKISRM